MQRAGAGSEPWRQHMVEELLRTFGLGKPSDDPTEQLVSKLMRAYTINRAIDTAGDVATKYFGEREHNELQDQDLRLSIAMKRQQLGMLDDDDYERMINDEGRDNTIAHLGMIGASRLDKIFTDPVLSNWRIRPSPSGGARAAAKMLTGNLPSATGASGLLGLGKLVGGNNVSRLGRAAKFFF